MRTLSLRPSRRSALLKFCLAFGLLCLASCAAKTNEEPGISANSALQPAAPAETGGASVDPRADAVLVQTGILLRNSAGFSFEAETMTDDVFPSGRRIAHHKQVAVQLRRPNRVRAEVRTREKHFIFLYDGNSIHLLDAVEKSLVSSPAPDSIDQALDYTLQRYNVSAPLADLLVSDPYGNLMATADKVDYLGEEYVGGELCRHIAAQARGVDWQLWITAAERPLPKKLVISYKSEPGVPQYTANFSNWNLSPGLPDPLFEPGSSGFRIDPVTSGRKH